MTPWTVALTFLLAGVSVWYAYLQAATVDHSIQNNNHNTPMSVADFWRLLDALDAASITTMLQRNSTLIREERRDQLPLHSHLDKWFHALHSPAAYQLAPYLAVAQVLVASTNLTDRCPIYFAVQYRLAPAMMLIGEYQDPRSLRYCLNMADWYGETALHAASVSKASGMARVYLSGAAQYPEIRATLRIGELPPQSSFSYSDLNNQLNVDDIDWLLTHGADVCAKSNTGDTPFHLACATGRLQPCRRLVKEALHLDCLETMNRYGLNVVHATASLGHIAVLEMMQSEWDPSLWARLSAARTNSTRAFSATQIACLSFHWDVARFLLGNRDLSLTQLCETDPVCCHTITDTPVPVPRLINDWKVADQSADRNACDIVEVPLNAYDSTRVLHDFVALSRPAIFRQAVTGWPALKLWTRAYLRKRLDRFKLRVGGIPYGNLYGSNETVMTLSTFLRKHMSNQTTSHPLYVFDGAAAGHELVGDAKPPPFIDIHQGLTLSQFMIGPAFSGAPPHFHGHAVNGLVFGMKKWFLLPPTKAVFSSLHVVDALKDQPEGVMECIQYPGDLVYIPRHWGHAVLNLADSAAMAYEFMDL